MDKQRIIRVGAILAVAGVTGFVMQTQGRQKPAPLLVAVNPDGASAPAAENGGLSAITPTVASADLRPAAADIVAAPPAPHTTAVTTAPTIAPAPAVMPDTATPLPVGDSAGPIELVADPMPAAGGNAASAETSVVANCSEDMALIAQPGAMLDLGLLAPCRINQRVLIRHAGLEVTARTSAAGTLIGSIPALQAPATVSLIFADGTSVSETVTPDDFDRFDRFAVQWSAEDAFQLAATGLDRATPPRAEGGFVIHAGDVGVERPQLAEIYTWPAGVSALTDEVILSIEAEVTAATCNREIHGETLQLATGRLTMRDLSFAMPDCAAIGDYIVMTNPVAPDRLASR